MSSFVWVKVLESAPERTSGAARAACSRSRAASLLLGRRTLHVEQ
jgi:hypothetical protein